MRRCSKPAFPAMSLLKLGTLSSHNTHLSDLRAGVPTPASLCSADSRGGCLYMSWGAAGETRVPRFARNDKPSRNDKLEAALRVCAHLYGLISKTVPLPKTPLYVPPWLVTP
jgi:hypothetical protein